MGSGRIEGDLSSSLVKEGVDGPDLSVHNGGGFGGVVHVVSHIVDTVVDLAEVPYKSLVSAISCVVVQSALFVGKRFVPFLEVVSILFVALDV